MASNEFKEIQKKYCGYYEDPHFWPHISLLAKKTSYITKVEWKRPWEITKLQKLGDPVFIDSLDYSDYVQRDIGNCWFVASAICVANSKQKDLLQKVVPVDQSFSKHSYSGAFRFNFWKFGRWVEVIIDDRLPTVNGKLIYGQNDAKPNEFWPALLEKAYAKFKGSYEDIVGGYSTWGFVDLTGGICDVLFTDPDQITTNQIAEKLLKYTKMNTLLACGTKKESNGIIGGHAYPIFNVKQVETKEKALTTIVHLRNPWGEREWTGRFRDHSKEWRELLTEKDQKATTTTGRTSEDGEFWISVEDLVPYISRICICHLPTTRETDVIANSNGLSQWNSIEYVGKLKQGVDNPQYSISLTKAHGFTDVVAQLLIRGAREFSQGLFGVRLSKVLPDGGLEAIEPLSRAVPEMSVGSIFCDLEPGNYVIEPQIRPGNEIFNEIEAHFYMRVFTEV